MTNSFRRASVKARSRDHGDMIERTVLLAALLVDRTLAASGQRDAGRALIFSEGIEAQQAFEAASDIIRKKRVRARS
jgi:hypothetical protein